MSVISAITPMMTRIMVMTAYSLRKTSLVQRMRVNTMRRPSVKLNTMKTATAVTVPSSDSTSTLPCVAMPKVTAIISQPTVSSMMADETMTWPRSRRMKFISRTTMATIFTEEIDSAVPRKSPATMRSSGSGSNSRGRNWASANPQANGTSTPVAEMEMQALRTRRTSFMSVSMPVSRSSMRMPS